MQDYLYAIAGIDPHLVDNADDERFDLLFSEAESLARQYVAHVRRVQGSAADIHDDRLILDPPFSHDDHALDLLQAMVDATDRALVSVDKQWLVPRRIPRGVTRLQSEGAGVSNPRTRQAWLRQRPDGAGRLLGWGYMDDARSILREPVRPEDVDAVLHAYVGLDEAKALLIRAIDGDERAIRTINSLPNNEESALQRKARLEQLQKDLAPQPMSVFGFGKYTLTPPEMGAVSGATTGFFGSGILLAGPTPLIVMIIGGIVFGAVGLVGGARYENMRVEAQRATAEKRRTVDRDLAETNHAIELDNTRFRSLVREAVQLQAALEQRVLQSLEAPTADAQQHDRMFAAVLELGTPPPDGRARQIYARLVTQSELAHAQAIALPGRLFIPVSEHPSLVAYRIEMDHRDRAHPYDPEPPPAEPSAPTHGVDL